MIASFGGVGLRSSSPKKPVCWWQIWGGFSLVNNPVLSSFLYGAFRARAVYGYREWIHRNIFISDTSSSGRCLSFALCTFLYWDAMSHSFFRIFKCDFLTLSDLEILSVNCFARFVSTESFDGSVSTECFFLFFSFWETSLAMFALSFLVPCVT